MKYSLIFAIAVLACAAKGASFEDATNDLALRSQIIGGSRVSPFGREYAVMLRFQISYREFAYCSGVRLNENWIVTAAQCLTQRPYSRVRVTFPKNGVFVHRYFYIADIDYVIHPNYDRKTSIDNIALLQISTGEWADESQHLKLPSKRGALDLFTGVEAEVTGFEHANNTVGEEGPVYLNSLLVKVEFYTRCTGKYVQKSHINEQICSSSIFTGQPRGLSEEAYGTPLVLKDKTFFGIAHHVSPSPLGVDEPIIFHRMRTYVEWIHTITGIPFQD